MDRHSQGGIRVDRAPVVVHRYQCKEHNRSTSFLRMDSLKERDRQLVDSSAGTIALMVAGQGGKRWNTLTTALLAVFL